MKAKKNYSRTTRKAENETQIPIELIMSSIGGQRAIRSCQNPSIFRKCRGTNQEHFNIGDIVFDIHRSEPWNRYLIPSHLSALKNEDKRISASVQRPNGKRPCPSVPPFPLLLPEEPTNFRAMSQTMTSDEKEWTVLSWSETPSG